MPPTTHLREVSSGFPVLSGHVLVPPGDYWHGTRRALEQMLAERFEIEHTTLQVDHSRRDELLRTGGSKWDADCVRLSVESSGIGYRGGAGPSS